MNGRTGRTNALACAVCIASLTVAGAARGQEFERISRTLPDGVEVIRDLPYASYGERALLLDLYLPTEQGQELLPSVVVIRGGGFRRGDKEAFAPLAAALAERGLAAVSIEYRTSDEAPFPAAVMDTKAAVRWIRANADRHGLNPEAVGAFGASAGGHLASYLGVTNGIEKLEGDGGHPGMASNVSAVVSLAGSSGFDQMAETPKLRPSIEQYVGVDPELWRFASPITHVDEASPPLLLVQGLADDVVPFTESLRLAKRYGEAGAHVELVLLPGAPHGFWFLTAWFGETMDRVASFFWRHLDFGPAWSPGQ